MLREMTFPLIPPTDDQGNPCDTDSEGNIKYDKAGKPLPPVKLWHEIVHASSFKRGNPMEHSFTTLKSAQKYGKSVLNVLPAIIFAILGELPPKWFSPAAERIVEEVTLIVDESGNWTGKWINQCDEEMDDILLDDMGFGEVGTISIEGLDLLEDRQEFSRPMDDMSVDTSIASTSSLDRLLAATDASPSLSGTDNRASAPVQHTNEDMEVDPSPPPQMPNHNPNYYDQANSHYTSPNSGLTAGHQQEDSGSPVAGTASHLTVAGGSAV